MSLFARYQIGRWLNTLLPDAAKYPLAHRAADLWRRIAAADREAVRANLSVILRRGVRVDEPVVREVFEHFASYLVEFFTAHRRLGSGITVNGCEALREVLRAHPASILLTAHLGNWELAAMMVARLGCPIRVVALPHADARVNRVFDAQRARCGVGVIPAGPGAIRGCLQVLRSGRALGIVADRPFGAGSVRAAFFGYALDMPAGPAVLSLRTGAPVVPVFLVREGRARFRFHVEPPLFPSTDSVEQLTQRHAEVIERAVRRFPTQWMILQPLFEDPLVAERNGTLVPATHE